MDRLKGKAKEKARAARDKVSSKPTGEGSLSVPHASLPPQDNASTTAVNEGYIGPQPGTAVRDYAQPVPKEPPTSLQSSVDAEKPLPGTPGPSKASSNPTTTLPQNSQNPQNGSNRLQVPARGSSAVNTPPRQVQNQTAPSAAPRRPQVGMRQPSIGIRRMRSNEALRQTAQPGGSTANLRGSTPLPALAEEGQPEDTASVSSTTTTSEEKPGRLRRASVAIQTKLGLKKDPEKDVSATAAQQPANAEYNASMVDVLDTLDPEVQTLTSLTNVQNSLFIPNLGRFVNRRPTYVLRQAPSEAQSLEEINAVLDQAQAEEPPVEEPPTLGRTQTTGTMATLATIDSRMSDSRYAVLPHGASLDGWTKEDKKELNDHVRHMLHSRRSRFKRSMRGFGQYVKRPLGFFVTLYATLITLFGLAWVLFLIGWINVGGRQLYIINVIDNVLVALFAIMGDGLAPFRAVDTYHMIYIAHYHHYTWSRRKKDRLPKLHDHNDLPASNAPISGPVDPADPERQWEFTVLTPAQQKKLEHHQAKFSNSHSFYKPHETDTHYAFPLRLLVAIVVLLDFHSIFQIALGACTWGIYYKVRPFALTTVILCCSIACNITGGLLIWIGDKRTRKQDVLDRMNRQELTEEAMVKIEKKKDKESESELEDEIDKIKKGRRSFDVFRSSSGEGRRSLDVFRRTASGDKTKEKEKEKEQSAYP